MAIIDIQQGIDKLLKDIQTTGITGTQGETLLAPQSLKSTPTGQPSPIIADQLGNQTTPITVPTPTPSYDTSSSLVAGAEAFIKQYEKLYGSPESETAIKVNTLETQLNDLLGKSGGRTEAQLAQESTLGLPESKKQLADLQGQIGVKLAEYKKIEADYLKEIQKTEEVPGVSKGIVSRQQDPLNKKLNLAKIASASDIGLLQAQSQALQGNITTAQETANRAIDLKYGAIDDEISIRKQQLDLLEGKLTKAEQKRKDALTLYLDEQKKKLEDDKALDKSIQSVMLEASSNGAPSNIISSISKSATYEDALKNAGGYMQTAKTTATEKTLSTSDVDWYQATYPDAGVQPGDTYEVANTKVQKLQNPTAKEFTESDFTTALQADKNANKSYDQVLSDIDSNTTIANKDLAKQVAAKVYGKQSETPTTPIYGKGNFTKIDIKDRANQLKSQGSAGEGFTRTYIREQLAKDGYPPLEIDKTLDSLYSGVSNFFYNLFK